LPLQEVGLQANEQRYLYIALPGRQENLKQNPICLKTVTAILLIILAPAISYSQHVLEPSMASTYNFQSDSLTGTCFMVSKDGNKYFISAAHLFKSSDKSSDIVPVQILINNQLKSFDAKVYFHPDKNVDIVVMKLPKDVSQGNGISLDTTTVDFGSEVFFYGFPLSNLGTQVTEFKFPLVKKGIISGLIKYLGVDVLVLDAHNNHGFSGGPVVAYKASNNSMCLLGVVSGYLFESRKLEYKGDRVALDENSGIMLCYGVNYINDIFKGSK
jgi:hypothetical protein